MFAHGRRPKHNSAMLAVTSSRLSASLFLLASSEESVGQVREVAQATAPLNAAFGPHRGRRSRFRTRSIARFVIIKD